MPSQGRSGHLFSLFVALLLSMPLFASDSSVIRVHDVPRSEYAQLRMLGDFWGVNWRENHVILNVTPRGRAAIEALGYRVDIDQEKQAELERFRNVDRADWLERGVGGIPGFSCYRTVDETVADLNSLVTARPDLAQWTDIGDSWRKENGLPDGDDIRALILANTASPHPQAPLVIMAAQHARELATAESATRFAEWLVNGYDSNATARWLLDHREIHIIAVHNPDGRREVEGGEFSWRKNGNNTFCPGTLPGVDLNRNSPVYFGNPNSSGSQCSEVFRGPSASSEPETVAVQNYLDSVFNDYRNSLGDTVPDTAEGIFLSIHSFGELILFPWEGLGSGNSNNAPNHDQLAWLGRKIGFFTDYQVGRQLLGPAGGTMVDYAHGELGVASYTYEIGTSFQQSCSSFENNIWDRVRNSLIYTAKAADRPYRAPSGPVVINASALYDSSENQLLIQGLADDTQFEDNNSGEVPVSDPIDNIQTVTASLDVPPALAPSTFAMTLEGSGSTVSFSADVNIDALDLSTPRLLFLQAADDQGFSGVPEAIWLQERLARVDPEQLDVAVAPGETATDTVVVSNVGSRTLTWSLATDLPARQGAIADPALDEVLPVGSFSVTGGASGGNIETFTIPGGVTGRGSVLGFDFAGDVSGISGESDWASDLRMIISSPDGDSFNVGGFSDVINEWEFQGGGSTNNGNYDSAHPTAFSPGTSDLGDWNLSFQHGWNSANASTMNWSNVSVTLKKQRIPQCEGPQAVSWLNLTQTAGSLESGESIEITVEIIADALPDSPAQALLCVTTDDPLLPLAVIEVNAFLAVDAVFEDRFQP